MHAPLQTSIGAIMLALVDNRPQIPTLRGIIDQYIRHRRVVVKRRTEFDLAEAERRAHILEGLKIALDHLDEGDRVDPSRRTRRPRAKAS